MSDIIAHNLNQKLRTNDVLVHEKYSFHSFLLSVPVLEGLKNSGFYKPSPIQIKAIPLGKCGLDLIVKAKSGTGKTVVFSVIALETVNTNINEPQVLILAPTREIAVQIQSVIKCIGGNIKDLKVHSFIGGLPIEDDIKKIDKCHIVVGAPGRLRNLVEKNYLKTKWLQLIVLDEADKLMEEVFQNDINYIYSKLPTNKQTLAVSATYSDDLCKFLKQYMHSPSFVSTEGENPVLLGIKQYVTVVKEHLNVNRQIAIKTEELIRLLSQISYTQCLVYFNTQSRAQGISNVLNTSGWKTLYISAAQSQSNRLKVMDSLKKFECRILLSTDLTARGIDVANVDFVINYDIPYDTVTYLHRMGRAGRYGSQGLCISIAGENKDLKLLQSLLGEVGGEVVSIAKLSKDDDIASNRLWECDYDSFEKIYGISSDLSFDSNEVAKDSDAKIVSSGLKHLTVTKDQSVCKDKINKEDAVDTETLFRNLAAGDSVSTLIDRKCANPNEHLSTDSEISFKSLVSDEICKEEINKDETDKYAFVSAETLFTSLAAGDDVSLKMDEKCTNVNKHTLIDSEMPFKSLPSEDKEKINDNGLIDEHPSSSTTSTSSSLLIDANSTDEMLVKPYTLPTEDTSNKIEGMNDWYPWVPVEGDSVLNNDENRKNLLDYSCKQKKRKLIENNKITKEQEIPLRNASLLSTCQLIEGNVKEEELTTHIDSIKKYLQCIKNEKQRQEINKIKKLDNLDDLWKDVGKYAEKSAECNDTNDPMENIFNLGYNYMIKNGVSWVEALDDYSSEDSIAEKQSDIEEEEEEEEDYFYEEEEEDYYEEEEDYYYEEEEEDYYEEEKDYYEEAEGDAEYEYDDSKNDEQVNSQTQITEPVEGCTKNLNKSQENYYNGISFHAHATYQQYFDYYGKNMCQHQNKFEDINSFTNYFNNWQKQILQCKEFVSQQIYVQSMNSYIEQEQTSNPHSSCNENNLAYYSTYGNMYNEENATTNAEIKNSTTNLPPRETNQSME